MSMSLRDQLLQAGLISKKQANDAERQQQRNDRPKQKKPPAPPEKVLAPQRAQSAKIARDLALNRQNHEKAEKKARLAQVKQWIDQNRLPSIEGEEFYNFVDDTKIRRIAVNASIRTRLGRGEVVIVRHAGSYAFVPAALAARIRERDPEAFIASGAAPEASTMDEAYQKFTVPDDLIW